MNKILSIAEKINRDKFRIMQLERRLFNDPCDNAVRRNLELIRRHLSNILIVEHQKLSDMN